MVTATEEQQAKDFLKRAEIKTMRKDLLSLREKDALKERDKIASIKTLEEQLQEQKSRQEKERAKDEAEKLAREEVLGKNATEERIAEKDLKNYGTEEERQQIFLLESQRLGFEKDIDAIEQEKDPALKLEKNNLLLEIRDWQEKLNSVLEDEKKLEDEQKFLLEKSQASTVPEERKSLEESRWDLDKKIQDIEKKRWEIEKEIDARNNKIAEVDKSSDRLVAEKGELKNKVLGADKSLREIYSVIINREEEKRKGNLEEQRLQREEAAKARESKNEDVRRQQWSQVPIKKAQPSIKEKIAESAKAEEEQRKRFLEDVQSWTETGGKDINREQQKTEGSVVERAQTSAPIPPVPKRQ